MKRVEILHGLVNVPDKLPMPAVAEFINRLSRLGLEREPVAFAQIHKPAME